MTSFLKKIISLIPEEKSKKLPYVFTISLLNTLLDFISIAILAPFILLIFDSQRGKDFLMDHFSLNLSTPLIISGIIALITFYIIKNYVQIRIISFQSKFVYGVATGISKKLVNNYLFGNYIKQVTMDKGSLIRDFQKLPIVYSTHILLSLYLIISELLIIGCLIIICLLASPLLTISAFFLVLIGALILIKMRNKAVLHLNQSIADTYKDALNQMINIFNGFLQIKSAKAETPFKKKFDKANTLHNQYVSQLNVYKLSNIRYLEIFIIVGVSIIVLYMQIGNTMVIDTVWLSFLVSSIIKLVPSFNKIINSFLEIKANRHSVDILYDYDLTYNKPVNNSSFSKTIELQNISYGYNKTSLILNDVSLSIKKGDFVAVSGKSGIGKTTLLRLLTGVLSPASGSILFDGMSNESEAFNAFTSIVTQHPFLFHGSLLENIVMLKKGEVNKKAILELFAIFELDDWLNSLPNKLDTQLDLDSKTISGGQKQRIALIRALYTKPKLLLLDEATNQLDSMLENKVLTYLKTLTEQKELAIVAVSHNKNLINYANSYYNMESKKMTS